MIDLLDDFRDDLKQPNTQSILIVVVSLFVAIGCLYIAQLLIRDHNMIVGSDHDHF